MELFLLLLVVPLLWLLLLPVRAIGRAQQHPFRTAGLLALLGFGGFVALFGLKTEPAPRMAEAPPLIEPVAADYASADTALRALLD